MGKLIYLRQDISLDSKEIFNSPVGLHSVSLGFSSSKYVTAAVI